LPRINGASAPFLMMNRNKRGIALNLKHEHGREILLRLVRDADVLTENYRRGTLEKLGVGYDVLSKANPGHIYCAISGYGMDGPFADKGGFDLIAQGFAGLMSITGEPGRPPVKPGNPVADINAGLLAAMGIWIGQGIVAGIPLDAVTWLGMGLAATAVAQRNQCSRP
jgi:crotonobetainyl-CoA:carnitine CoA-transferase CaiB-like acyl-CoA transferase